MVLLVLILTITCIPLTAMASESHGQVIDILADGYYITDPDGNVVPTARFTVDENVVLKPGYSLNAQNNVWYNGEILRFYASVSNARVTDLELKAQRVNSSKFNSLGSFIATQGQWYGCLECIGMPDGSQCYYRIKFINNGSSTMTIDSLTAKEYTP
ncbi:hypothetical protein [Aminipila terrae]|uniref:Uncharacterized protein n=1 Tax=Aminipila terrae TaxID=2697030 RepID=A0A6P1ME05_9FIRM|nr:hypothetical protein [Aminipila terrae]QHI72137.1 hypothetical protein Ami3637_06730 [Aminipila terrae]